MKETILREREKCQYSITHQLNRFWSNNASHKMERQPIRGLIEANIKYSKMLWNIVRHCSKSKICSTSHSLSRIYPTIRKDFVILQLYWWLFSSTKHCS